MSDEQKNKFPDDESTDGPDADSGMDADWLDGEEPAGSGDVVEPYSMDENAEKEEASESDSSVAPNSDESADEPIAKPEKEAKTKKSVTERLAGWRAGAGGEGVALSRAGTLGWKFFVIMSIGALIAAVVLSITNTTSASEANFWQKLGPGSLESLRVLLRAPVHLSVGILAFAMTAWAVGVRAGRGDLAAVRIGLAVSLAIMALELEWSFPGQRIAVYLIAFAMYFTTVWISFRCHPKVAATLVVLHVGLFGAIAGLGWLIIWIGM